MSRASRGSYRISILAVLIAPMIGCSGGGAGNKLVTRPDPVALGAADGQKLVLPTERPFSIAVPSSQREAGLEGTAEAASDAKSDGSAQASASVTNGGTATAGFQVGHVFENALARQIDVDIRVRANIAYEAAANPGGRMPDAAVNLNLFALDARNRVLNRVSLIEHTTDRGTAVGSGDEDSQITITLGPGKSVAVYVAGEVRINASTAHNASGSLELSGLQMELISRPAPAVRSAADDGA